MLPHCIRASPRPVGTHKSAGSIVGLIPQKASEEFRLECEPDDADTLGKV